MYRQMNYCTNSGFLLGFFLPSFPETYVGRFLFEDPTDFRFCDASVKKAHFSRLYFFVNKKIVENSKYKLILTFTDHSKNVNSQAAK